VKDNLVLYQIFIKVNLMMFHPIPVRLMSSSPNGLVYLMSQFILYAHDVDDINDNDHDADVDKLDYQAN